jgi:hypothetical protein
MTLHAFIEYLKYNRKAKGRHGTHSPFVYDLIEHVLRNKELIDKTYIVAYPSLALRYENLISRIAAYYGYRNILYLPSENDHIINAHADMLLLSDAQPLQWLNLLDKYVYLLYNKSAVAAIGIHKTAEHIKQWQKLCTHSKVRMSIDVYGIGLLFFREEFKEPQHFILKY